MTLEDGETVHNGLAEVLICCDEHRGLPVRDIQDKVVGDTRFHLGDVKYRVPVAPEPGYDLAVHAFIGEEVQAVSRMG